MCLRVGGGGRGAQLGVARRECGATRGVGRAGPGLGPARPACRPGKASARSAQQPFRVTELTLKRTVSRLTLAEPKL